MSITARFIIYPPVFSTALHCPCSLNSVCLCTAFGFVINFNKLTLDSLLASNFSANVRLYNYKLEQAIIVGEPIFRIFCHSSSTRLHSYCLKNFSIHLLIPKVEPQLRIGVIEPIKLRRRLVLIRSMVCRLNPLFANVQNIFCTEPL